MGFFSTGAGPNGEPQLLIAPQWWWLLVLAIPLTALTYLMMYVLGTWKIPELKTLRSHTTSDY